MKKYLIPAVVIGALILIAIISSGVLEGGVDRGVSDPANTTYIVEGEEVRFRNGSAGAMIIFGQPVTGDLDADGDNDMALVFQQASEGTGTFYYLAVALQNDDMSARGTNAIFVGDRIAPQTLEIKDNVVIFNYAERKPDEPMIAQPSVGVSFYAVVENGVLIQQEAGE